MRAVQEVLYCEGWPNRVNDRKGRVARRIRQLGIVDGPSPIRSGKLYRGQRVSACFNLNVPEHGCGKALWHHKDDVNLAFREPPGPGGQFDLKSRPRQLNLKLVQKVVEIPSRQ